MHRGTWLRLRERVSVVIRRANHAINVWIPLKLSTAGI